MRRLCLSLKKNASALGVPYLPLDFVLLFGRFVIDYRSPLYGHAGKLRGGKIKGLQVKAQIEFQDSIEIKLMIKSTCVKLNQEDSRPEPEQLYYGDFHTLSSDLSEEYIREEIPNEEKNGRATNRGTNR
jgi:hypothetical protein